MSSSGSGSASGPASGGGAYPTAADLQAFLEAAGLTTTGLDLATAVQAGRQRFERETGRRMLAVTQTRTFDPPTNPTGTLNLRADLVLASSVSVAGVALAATEYQFLPHNAVTDGQPFTMIRFQRRWYGPLEWSQLGTVSITGSWGFAAAIPDDAWTAMLQAAALDRLPQIGTALSEGLISWKEADVEERYGDNPLSGLSAEWKSGYAAAATRYRKVQVGVG